MLVKHTESEKAADELGNALEILEAYDKDLFCKIKNCVDAWSLGCRKGKELEIHMMWNTSIYNFCLLSDHDVEEWNSELPQLELLSHYEGNSQETLKNYYEVGDRSVRFVDGYYSVDEDYLLNEIDQCLISFGFKDLVSDVVYKSNNDPYKDIIFNSSIVDVYNILFQWRPVYL